MRNWFVLNGVDSRDFGVYISGQGTFSAPRREYDMISIPGRNGDLVGNEKRFENLELTYRAFIYANFKENIRNFRNFLLSQVGYKKLTDSYHPDEFRMAVYEGPFEPDVTPRNDAGEFEIVFNCKPQRYLNSGEEVISFDGDTNTYSGEIVTFEGKQGDSISKITATIEPVQEGSGDPSPDNIRPIRGYTGMTVQRTGKNLIRYPYSQESRETNGITYTNNADGSVTVSGTASAIAYHNLKSWSSDANSIVLKAGTTLTLSGGTDDARIYVQYRVDGSTQNVTLGIDAGNGVTFTIPEEADTAAIFIRVNRDVTVDTTIYPMLRLATVADDTYEPYISTIYSITIPSSAGTVYGGNLDVTNGVLTVDRAMIASYNGETLPSTWISDRDVYAQGTTPTTGAQVVYTLATPITYQLTPQEVDTLIGTNNVFADTGGVAVTVFSSAIEITNPTRHNSQPLLRVYGAGQLGINSDTITISSADGYTDIDCEMMDCFKGLVNKNQFVGFSSYNFPVLQPGENNISLGSGITRVDITPRWWRL